MYLTRRGRKARQELADYLGLGPGNDLSTPIQRERRARRTLYWLVVAPLPDWARTVLWWLTLTLVLIGTCYWILYSVRFPWE